MFHFNLGLKKALLIFFIFFIWLVNFLQAQNKDFDRLIKNEFKMTFPSVYFKNNSTEFAQMPYTADSCFKYVADNIENLKTMSIWRDSSESSQLNKLRIKQLKKGIRKHIKFGALRIKSVNERQKITSHTISLFTDSLQTKYLLSLNAVFDVSSVVMLPKVKKSHTQKPRWWCRWCWGRGSFSKKYRAWRKRNNLY